MSPNAGNADATERGTGTALVPYSTADAVVEADNWMALDSGERKRRAVAAAQDRDTEALQRLAASWLITYGRKGAAVSRETLTTYRYGIASLLEAWTEETLLHPKRMAARRWLRALEAEGLKPASTRVYLAAAKALYSALREAGATEDDPFVDVRPAHDPVPRHEKALPYSDDEIKALLGHAKDDDRLLVLLGSLAGLRVSEMLSLQWRDIDLGRRQLVVQSGKGRRKRTVPLAGSLVDELAARRGAHAAPLFAYPGTPRQRRLHAWYRMRDLCQDAGIDYHGRGVHGLRHTAGTRLQRDTGNLQTVRDFLGHSSVTTTEVYMHHADHTARDAVKDW